MDAVVCGIDPGVSTTGYAVLARRSGVTSILDAGVCRFKAELTLARRLVSLFRDIREIVVEHRPGTVAVEALFSHYKHPRTAILMGHARGVVILAAAQSDCVLRSYTATRIKRFLTGNGRASKEQVQRAIQTNLSLDEIPEPNDLADAMAIALCCLDDIRAERVVEAIR